MGGAATLRNEAYIWYVAVTRDAWTTISLFEMALVVPLGGRTKETR
jgi:hypothetical protein